MAQPCTATASAKTSWSGRASPLVNELKRLLQTNGYMLSAIVSGSQENPDKLKRATTSVAELESLTVADLDQVARKYLGPDAALPVVIVPGKTAKPEAAARRRSGRPTAAAVVSWSVGPSVRDQRRQRPERRFRITASRGSTDHDSHRSLLSFPSACATSLIRSTGNTMVLLRSLAMTLSVCR